jgi:translation initiation factor 4G
MKKAKRSSGSTTSTPSVANTKSSAILNPMGDPPMEDERNKSNRVRPKRAADKAAGDKAKQDEDEELERQIQESEEIEAEREKKEAEMIRNNAPGPFAMGQFGAVAGKTLPPGTTSDQRFAVAQGTMPRPAVGSMSSFSRPGGTSLPGSNPMSRNASSSQMYNMPNSLPQSSKSQRNNSWRDNHYTNDAQVEAKAAKTTPLTAGMDLKPTQASATGWKPRSIGNQAATGTAGPTPGVSGGAGYMEPERLQRKVKAALNKMTPEKFDKIADQILAIAAQSKDEADGRTLRQVVQLTFEKATDDTHWASMYAKFCKRMLETMSPDIKDESILDKTGNFVSGGNLFRKYLINRCQEEFERGWKIDLPDKPESERGDEKSAEAAMLSDEYYVATTAKRRGLGLFQFLGELYKLSILTERIMHECVMKLIDQTGIPDEAEIESLTKLLKTIGSNLDSTEKGKPMMDVYFVRIQMIIDTPDLPSRLRFMLMDIVDLRKKRWVSKEANKGPKTLDEVRAEVRYNPYNHRVIDTDFETGRSCSTTMPVIVAKDEAKRRQIVDKSKKEAAEAPRGQLRRHLVARNWQDRMDALLETLK